MSQQVTAQTLRKLAEISSADRAFLSLYLADPQSMSRLERRIKTDRALVQEHDDEKEYLEENVKLVEKYLDKHPHTQGSLCIFACWVLDFFEVYTLPVPPPDLFWIDSSPYIRPLAEFLDEYENYAVVAADNSSARVYLVTLAVTTEEKQLKGNIKNNVKVGGWSQQRYKRRRDKQLQHYAKDIARTLQQLEQEKAFRRVLLVGSRETLQAIRAELPSSIARMAVADKALDLKKGDDWLDKEIFDLFSEQERDSEEALWEQIKATYLRHGLAAVGIEDVLLAAKEGRVDKAVALRDVHFEGFRCRQCEHLGLDLPAQCPACGSESLFSVDLLNECVELLTLTSAEIDFVDPIPSLHEMGSIGALLRY